MKKFILSLLLLSNLCFGATTTVKDLTNDYWLKINADGSLNEVCTIPGPIPLPTGAATSANQLLQLTQETTSATNTTSILANQTNGTQTTKSRGLDASLLVRLDYSMTNVTTLAYVQLVASTADIINQLYIFDSSGQTLFLAVGAAASEVDQIYIVPGGNGIMNLYIPLGSRISVKAVSGTANSGELNISGLK